MSKGKKKTLKIGITLGDFNGIGPELIISAFSDQRLREQCTPVIYGSPRVLNIWRKHMQVDRFSYNVIEKPDQAHSKKISVIDCVGNFDRVEIGQPSKDSGRAAFAALQAAVKDLQFQSIDALVTNPIDKHTIQGDGFDFPGHTEYFTQAFGVEESLMLMTSERLKVGVVTGHVPVKDISGELAINKIVQKIKILNETLKVDFSIERPRIAVLGLNPHAGDNGLLGKEDREYIGKALQEVEKKKILAVGPFPADGFFGMGTYAQFDAVLAMYHDQGLIPFKLLAGLRGVNFTAGLPIIRTSPDHGVAYNIAGKGQADPTSLREAIYAAIDIYHNREENTELYANALKVSHTSKSRKESVKDQSRPQELPAEEAPEGAAEGASQG